MRSARSSELRASGAEFYLVHSGDSLGAISSWVFGRQPQETPTKGRVPPGQRAPRPPNRLTRRP